MPFRRFRLALPAALLVAAGTLTVVGAPAAQAAGESVNIWLTTTSDSGGRTVTRGLQQQAPVSFAATSPGAAQTINVSENTTYQQFEGGGASFTDTAAWLMNSSGALSASTRTSVMQKLFDPVNGIGLSFVRNPLGSSDLARNNYSFDETCCDLNGFSINHDLADVLPLTKQAKALNPALKVMASPWSAPAWMKDNNSLNQGWLQSQYYGLYGEYFAKYIQAYQAQGVPIDYVSVQNEPTCCPGYPSMQWNTSGIQYFIKNALWPAFRNAGITTKTLVNDWNWDAYNTWAAPLLADTAIRNDPLFGGIAWHGYGGDVTTQTTVHNQYPQVNAYMTEHSGGGWIGDQQTEDMNNLIDYTRNWDRSWVKWSLAVDQNHGPHNGGCDICTGLITVHNGDSRSGQVDYTIEYYTMGHLTKFVRPGAYRIDSTANSAVKNVAWKNPDGSKALIAYNTTGSTQTVKVNWGGQSFTYSLPTKTSATFTWSGTPSGGGSGSTGQITGIGGKCVDVAAASSANGTQVQLYTCNGTAAQSWTVGTDGTIRALGKCLDVAAASSANGTKVQIYDCNGSAAQRWTPNSDGTLRALGKCLDATGPSSADGTPLQIWDCFAGSNQRWTLPSGGTTPPPPTGAKMPGAPYLYMGWGSPPSATSVMSSTGIKSFTMAFILSGGGCTPMWDGARPLTGGVDAQTISAVKNAGGSVQVSFGGWSGNKLGPNCSSAAAYANAVQQVINAVGPAVVDFDIENTDEFSNYTVQDRILNGLKIVKQNNPNVKIAVTFGTSTSGPSGDGIRLINQSRALNVPIDAYTIMPFDFGGGANMYQSTVNAAEGLKNALKSAWGWTDAQAYGHMGISGMNGVSDQQEVTTQAIWTQIRDYANSKGLVRLAFWSVNRDRPCAGGGLQETCSGLGGSNWDFTRITAGF